MKNFPNSPSQLTACYLRFFVYIDRKYINVHMRPAFARGDFAYVNFSDFGATLNSFDSLESLTKWLFLLIRNI